MAGPGQQTVQTASYGANRLGFDVGEFVHINLGRTDEEYVQVLAADSRRPDVHGDLHEEAIRRRDGAADDLADAVLNEGDSLAFDILAVATQTPAAT